MRADIHDGQEARNAPCNGPNTDAQDQLSPDRHIRLAPHGRSIQSTWSNDDGRRPARDGGPSCIITRQTLLPWFVVPTVGFDLLYAFVVRRRELVWINVTANPTAEWVARQITEAFPWDEAPGYMVRDRDRIFGGIVTRRLRTMGIRDRPIAPASPWQNGFAERLIGSIRRECLDHIVVFGEAHLRGILRSYARYYNDIRTHRSLDKDAPVSRPVQRTGNIKSFPILGGLHHRYARG
jgi:transposase InsO family protein